MSKLFSLATLTAIMMLAACGGSSGFSADGTDTTDPTMPDDPDTPVVANVTVLASSPNIPSDNTQTVTISAIVSDSNNVAMSDVTVVLATDSGFLTVDNAVTDATGVATATLSAGGDPTNRPITITASAVGVEGTVTVNVVGTTLSLTGPSALPQGDSGNYTVVLQNASGDGIQGRTVDISSSNGNTLASTSLTTDISGQAQVQLTAAAAGADTLTAGALGLSATKSLNVSDDSFVISVPLTAGVVENEEGGIEVDLNTAASVALQWEVGGTAQSGETISFSATRGTLSSPTAMTNASGQASVTIQSTNAGPAVIEASNSSGTSTQVTVEFVATTPATIDAQASPFTIGPEEQSSISAIVRDATNNLVKNSVVVFELDDVTGGQLSVASATTNSQGRASTFYTAGSTTSANNGVTVTASLQSDPGINDEVQLTVAKREVFISVGTGNEISEPNTAQYRKEFVVQVSDSQGNGVAGVTVQVGVLSNNYYKGVYIYNGSVWEPTVSATCDDEDVNRNGVLDTGEDFNTSGRIEAGNIATVSAQDGGGGTFTTDSSGFGVIDVYYPQEFANWVRVTLTATTSVQGTESAESSTFVLPVLGADVSDEAVNPPGNPSPFGVSNSCADTD